MWGRPRGALGIWLGFHALLRPGEITGLEWRDVVVSEDIMSQQGNFAIATIRNPKTRGTGPRRQHVLVTDPLLLHLLRKLRPHCGNESSLVQFTPSYFTRWFAKILARLEIPPKLYTPSSLRAGGATFEYLSSTPIPELRFRGRWMVEKTLDHYIQECATFLDVNSFPASTLQNIQVVASCVPYLVGSC